jgi:hypothetical protein
VAVAWSWTWRVCSALNLGLQIFFAHPGEPAGLRAAVEIEGNEEAGNHGQEHEDLW